MKELLKPGMAQGGVAALHKCHTGWFRDEAGLSSKVKSKRTTSKSYSPSI